MEKDGGTQKQKKNHCRWCEKAQAGVCERMTVVSGGS